MACGDAQPPGAAGRKLGEDASNPTYIFAEPRVGYRMARGKKPEQLAE